MRWADILTFSRIILLIPMLILIWYDNYVPAFVLLIILAFTDWYDGVLARQSTSTMFGKIMDPVADKILINSILILFAYLNLFNPIALILLIARDLLADGFRMEAAAQHKKIAAGIWGKVKTFGQFILIALILLSIPSIITTIITWLVVLISWYSFLRYVYQWSKP